MSEEGGSWQKGRKGPLSNAWRGGRRITKGYAYVYKPDHPHAIKTGYVAEHIFVASEMMGGRLPDGVIVHHIDEDILNNKPTNLMICPDDQYHKIIHMRIRAKKESGYSFYLKCRHCKKWDDPKKMYVSPRWKYANHRECHRRHVAMIAQGKKE